MSRSLGRTFATFIAGLPTNKIAVVRNVGKGYRYHGPSRISGCWQQITEGTGPKSSIQVLGFISAGASVATHNLYSKSEDPSSDRGNIDMCGWAIAHLASAGYPVPETEVILSNSEIVGLIGAPKGEAQRLGLREFFMKNRIMFEELPDGSSQKAIFPDDVIFVVGGDPNVLAAQLPHIKVKYLEEVQTVAAKETFGNYLQFRKDWGEGSIGEMVLKFRLEVYAEAFKTNTKFAEEAKKHEEDLQNERGMKAEEGVASEPEEPSNLFRVLSISDHVKESPYGDHNHD